MDDWRETNRASWDARTPAHLASRFYDVERWKAGGCSLTPIELEEVGSVEGKRLLHLQCHFGQDTLSWARRGATVVGLDFSPEAIGAARRLADELKLPARFVCADVYSAAVALGETFDIVFTSYGALAWLPDLDAWAKQVAACLKRGGRFHLVEFHPLVQMYSPDLSRLAFPYDSHGVATRTEDVGTYADREAPIRVVDVEWSHGLGTVVNSLIRAGLVLESLREHDWSPYPLWPGSVEIAPGRYQVSSLPDAPLVYSVIARQP
jgi:SAM-dependent methyltransferase